ncbi:hypothetical protein ABID23_000941 [Bartonella silvatica]|uniref:Uncharacterized protein n=1 Tax=Bartonella silvatica TaxID=357760 RepID=A0ABV2HH20_9HYPH
MKNDGEVCNWFLHYACVFSPMRLFLISEIAQTIHTLALIWYTKAETVWTVLMRLNFCLKHTAVCGLDVNLQATAKARDVLDK